MPVHEQKKQYYGDLWHKNQRKQVQAKQRVRLDQL